MGGSRKTHLLPRALEFSGDKEGTSNPELPTGCPWNMRDSSLRSSPSDIACGDNGFP